MTLQNVLQPPNLQLLELSDWRGDNLDASHLFTLSCWDAKVLSFRLWQRRNLFSREPKPLKWNLAVGCDSFEMPASGSGAQCENKKVFETHIHGQSPSVRPNRRYYEEQTVELKVGSVSWRVVQPTFKAFDRHSSVATKRTNATYWQRVEMQSAAGTLTLSGLIQMCSHVFNAFCQLAWKTSCFFCRTMWCISFLTQCENSRTFIC